MKKLKDDYYNKLAKLNNSTKLFLSVCLMAVSLGAGPSAFAAELTLHEASDLALIKGYTDIIDINGGFATDPNGGFFQMDHSMVHL